MGMTCAGVLALMTATMAPMPGAAADEPIVIGHRGASGYLPEHTLAAYFVAVEQGADYIEPDLVMTKDGVLVARHENEISGTTDVADRPEFADRRKTKSIDEVETTGWFTEDFTLAELKTLKAKERLPDTRPDNTRFDGQFQVPTFAEVLDLVRAMNLRFQAEARQQGLAQARTLGVYPETKHPTYFDSLGLSMEVPLIRTLRQKEMEDGSTPVFIQSFETGNLRELNGLTDLPLVQLINNTGKPYDFVVNGDPRTYADLATPAGLAEIATYADGVGVNKALIIPRTTDGRLGTPTALIADAHAAGLIVHGWTFRAENTFLPVEFRSSDDPNALGDMAGEVTAFLEQGMDGFFTDHPVIGVVARDAFVQP
jgi:glycerophosphoryl diester phosphodiesterase